MDNSCYSVFTFFPLIIYNQFKHFLNLYFLIIALLQLVPALRVGQLSGYFSPVIVILIVSCIKELFDEIRRRKKDREVNNEKYM